MRPHRLRVTAFGAFGGTVEVSFEDLACSGLFLLHGETGAGKTTLLDAIGFALYGRVPGERGKARRLRSDHAAPGTPTEVQLEATLGGRLMRITRKPEQERAKLRGAGTTTEQAKLLQRLFGTDRFHAVEEWLARRRKATADEVREAELGISGLVARVAQAAGVPVPSDDAVPSHAALPSGDAKSAHGALPPAGWAARLAEAAAAGAAAGQAQVAGHRRELDRALDLLRDAERLADRQRRRQDALDTRDRLATAEAGLKDK